MKPIAIFLLISLLLSPVSCASRTKADGIECNLPPSHILGVTEDLGEEYLDGFIFFGESTTYHMKSRGVLRDGVNTKQVWAPPCGTVNLDPATKDIKIVYPETDKKLTVAEAAAQKKPEYIVFTFGLNGAVQKVNKGKELFCHSYLLLIDSVRKASPKTKIILQSAFPISKNMDTKSYTVSSETLNNYIDTINSWASELAEKEGLRYLNTSEALKDKDGYLCEEYDAGDGHHLSKEAYIKILTYIRTHGYR